MTPPDNSTYRFAEFELEPDERRLIRGGQPVPLTPKLFDILKLLVERAGHVVSKDDLLSKLWPGRFVLESNLTKHIWMLRKALGENGDGERFIETVSKLGYRFAAPVTRGAGVPDAIPHLTSAAEATPKKDSSSASAIPRSSLHWLISLRVAAVTGVLFACIALASWWLWNGRQPTFPWSANPPGTVIAIVQFDNLSRNPRDAWVSPALEEMLATEIAIGDRLHTVPGELVRAARNRLPDPNAGGFAPDSLAELHRRLATDYVVSGSYLASDKPGNPVIRLDLAVQDARNGATIASFKHTGSIGDLPSLIASAGADLRGRLGVKAQNPEERQLVANAQPPTADVMRHVGFALDALHHSDAARARDQLLQAVAEAPDYAPAYAYLSKAWTALGYHNKAVAAVRRAVANSVGLPTFMRLQIEAQNFETQYNWKSAIQTLRNLAALQQANPEVQLELIDVLLSAGRSKDAQDTLDALRGQNAPMSGDARLELAAARIASAQDDAKAVQSHAAHALQLARATEDSGLAAEAERMLGVALTSSDRKKATEMLSRALVDYHSAGNPRGEASVHRDIGNLLADTQPKLARGEYEESLARYQEIGDRNGVASAYSDLAVMLWAAGDGDGAEAATRNVLQIRRETGDIAGQAWALAALAVGQSDDRASDEVIAEFREAAALDASIGAHSHRGFTLYSLSDIFRLRGELEEARNVCAEAQAEYAKMSDPTNRAMADFECALIALDRGDVTGAQAGVRRARDAAIRRGDSMTLANGDLTLGQIEVGQDNCSDALRFFAAAEREYARGELSTGQAIAASFTALCTALTGNAGARNAVARAVTLRRQITERQEVMQVDINLAELHGANGERDQAVSALQSIAKDAQNRNWPGWAMEAELAQMRVLLRSDDHGRAEAMRARIIVDARQRGFAWVLRRARPL
jgi:eukaryotic-like serine/threonine-protein kinase